MTFSQVMSSWSWLVSAILTIAGWFAVFWFQVVSQKRAFLLQTRKEAWRDLHSAILQYQSAVGRDANEIHRLYHPFWAANTDPHTLERTIADAEDWAVKPSGGSAADVLFLLENYETLFPETSLCRLQLANIDMNLQSRYSDDRRNLVLGLAHQLPPREVCGASLAESDTMRGLAFDQIALLQDLLIFLQNSVFSSITKNVVPARTPVGDNRVRLSLNVSDGKLHIVDGKGIMHDAALSQTTAGPVPIDWA